MKNGHELLFKSFFLNFITTFFLQWVLYLNHFESDMQWRALFQPVMSICLLSPEFTWAESTYNRPYLCLLDTHQLPVWPRLRHVLYCVFCMVQTWVSDEVRAHSSSNVDRFEFLCPLSHILCACPACCVLARPTSVNPLCHGPFHHRFPVCRVTSCLIAVLTVYKTSLTVTAASSTAKICSVRLSCW